MTKINTNQRIGKKAIGNLIKITKPKKKVIKKENPVTKWLEGKGVFD